MDICHNLIAKFLFLSDDDVTPNFIECHYNEDEDWLEYKLCFPTKDISIKKAKSAIVIIKVLDRKTNKTLIKPLKIKLDLTNEKKTWGCKTSPLGLRHGESLDASIAVTVEWSSSKRKAISLVKNVTIENHKQSEVIKLLTKQYEELQRIKAELYQYKPYRKVFFSIQEKMRQAIGMVRYSANHCPEPISEKKYVNRLVIMLGNKIPSSVHNAGFNMETGEPFKKADTFETVSVSPLVSEDVLKNEIDSLTEEISQMKKDRVYHDFWMKTFDILKKYELDDEDQLRVAKDRAEIEEDVKRMEALFSPLGYELKYYEDFEDKESMEAKLFMIDGVFGYPALYYKNGEMVSSGEGKRDQP